MMADLLPTFEYRGDEVHALFEGHVIASGTDFSKVSVTASEYLDGLHKKRKHDEHEAARKAATHITTPNGAKGEILNRVASIWGDEITVRFENGQIRRYATAAGDDRITYSKEAAEAPKNIREALQHELDEDYTHGVPGLTARLKQLDQVKTAASQHAARENNPVELQEFHKIVLLADHEKAEIKEALDHLQAADTEAMVPPAPVMSAVEQADLGRAKGDSWLDVLAREMIAESENEDYDKLLSEGPSQFVSGLDDAAIHDAGSVREAAVLFIHSRTAGFQGEKVADYRERFVAKCEQARRQDLVYRKDVQHKEAAAKEDLQTSLPDDSLFL